jgi:hypothetical protein
MSGKVVKMPKLGPVRQGDVFLVPVKKVPPGCTELKNPIVHRGEGANSHRMVGDNFKMVEDSIINKETGEKDLFIIVTPEDAEKLKQESKKQEPATLSHEEHDHIELLPGIYRVRRSPQREYDGMATNTNIDRRIITRDVID